MEIMHEMHRDINTGFMVKEMIKSGYYDEEFQLFGVAYWQDNEVHYLVSSDEISICAAFEQMMLQGIIVTPIEEILCHINMTAVDRKQSLFTLQEELKQKLIKTYPLKYFSVLTKSNNKPNKNTAFSLLQNYKNKLQNNLSNEKWNAFVRLVQTAMSAKLLTVGGHKALLENMPLPGTQELDKYQTMTGFAYLDDSNQWKYYANGYRPKTMETKLQKVFQKVLSTPILEYPQNIENNQAGQLSAIRKDFLLFMYDILDKEYLAVLQQLQELPPAISKETFLEMVKTTIPVISDKAKVAINGYGFLWNLL